MRRFILTCTENDFYCYDICTYTYEYIFRYFMLLITKKLDDIECSRQKIV